jgi:hypothetical protein
MVAYTVMVHLLYLCLLYYGTRKATELDNLRGWGTCAKLSTDLNMAACTRAEFQAAIGIRDYRESCILENEHNAEPVQVRVLTTSCLASQSSTQFKFSGVASRVGTMLIPL